MSHTTPVVYIVDDDVSVRESLKGLVDSVGWHAHTFETAQAFLCCPQIPAPCCMVLDMTLPDLSGLELQQRVCADRADMPIIFISGYGDVPSTVQAMKAGAVEFFTKPFRADELLTAICSAIERSLAALRNDQGLQLVRARYASLTPRERDVMMLVVAGLLNKQVGSELGISEITVKAHRGHMMKKMNARSLPDLVRMAERLAATRGGEIGGPHLGPLFHGRELIHHEPRKERLEISRRFPGAFLSENLVVSH